METASRAGLRWEGTAERESGWSEGFGLGGGLAGAPLRAPRQSVCLCGQRSLLDPQGMSSRGLAMAPPAKNVVVYRNGDPFFPGRKVVVNQRRFLTFEAFLNEVTKSIHAPLAVRNLYTPRHGHRVAELGDLQDGCQYVAAGFEKFKRLDYLNRGRKELRGTRNSEGLQFRTVAPWKSNVLARRQKHAQLPCTIHVFRNGDLLSPPFPLLLSKSTPLQWDALLATLTKKADLRSGAVNKLCRLDGTQVSGGEELVNGHYYVAVGNEEYKKLPYFELLVPQDSACRTLWNHPKSRRKKYRRRFGELCAISQDRAGDSALAEPTQQLDSRRVQTTGAAEKDKIPAAFPQLQRQGRKSCLREEESIFHAKPVRAGQNRRSNRNVQHWPDQEESVYKTRDPRKKMRGAQEVKEDEHTGVDVPIDQARTTEKSQKTAARKRDASDSEDEKY
ncbi:doublecortin domain-containing protein 2B isoform X2 [Calonectris borealis]|uniref:doublecortin domain-containing protein 2B isoform X2 n=1 Tax=Calonectris borealis TaxID=1323832 RepID=UPI003F4C7078